MKKIALLLTGLFVGFSAANAQDTLVYENFNDTIPIPNNFGNYPNAILNDTMWTNWDEDGIADGSTNGDRPGEWWWTYPYTIADSTAHSSCFASSSWTNDAATPVANWLISNSIQITDGASAMVSWLSAPYQTPYYCDGYVVLVSTTTNDLDQFTDTLFVAAEYVSGAATGGNNFANYTFSPGFVHGLDGNYMEFNPDFDNNPADTTTADRARMTGLLQPFSASLAAYDNMKIYIAWKHNAHDDNLLIIDDLLVTETTDPTFSIESLPEVAGQVYPNPATDYVNVKFDIEQYHNAHVQLVNSNGQVVYTSALTTANSRIDLQNIAAGVYFVKITSDEGNMVKKLVVNK